MTSRSIAAIAAALEVDALWLETGVGEPDAVQGRTVANLSDVGLLVTLFGRLDALGQSQVMDMVKTLAKLQAVNRPNAANDKTKLS